VLLVVSWVLDMRGALKSADAIGRKRMGRHLMVAVAALLIIALNVWLGRADLFSDLSENRIYTLSDETVEYLQELKEPVVLYGFATKGGLLARQMETVFKRYSRVTDKLETKIIDPDRNPGLASKFNVTGDGEAVLSIGEKWTKLNGFFERDLAIGIVRLTVEANNICFTKGHGETTIRETPRGQSFSKFASGLEERGYTLIEDTLANIKAKGECNIVAAISPKSSFSVSEISILNELFDGGTGLLFLADPLTASDLNDFLGRFNLELMGGVLSDERPQIAGAPVTTVATGVYLSHPITEGLSDISYFPLADPVTVIDRDKKPEENAKLDFLVMTSQNSWLKVHPKAGASDYAFKEGEDIAGAFYLTAAYQQGENRKLVIFGDSDFANDFNYDYGDNSKLIENSVQWLRRDKEVVKVPKKEMRETRLKITVSELNATKYALVYAYPFVIFGICFIVWYRRSR